jgi:hypothetical protein
MLPATSSNAFESLFLRLNGIHGQSLPIAARPNRQQVPQEADHGTRAQEPLDRAQKLLLVTSRDVIRLKQRASQGLKEV